MASETSYNNILSDDLLAGKAPQDPRLLRELSVGFFSLTDFLTSHYLEDYIPAGGSKLKFVTGRPGAGKTHFSRYLSLTAKENHFLTVSFSAKDVRLHDFREIYLEILRQCDIETILSGCASQIIRAMDKDPSQVDREQTFMDYLAEHEEADALSRSEIRSFLRSFFTKNPRLDNSFACCCSLLTGNILGHPVLEPANKEILLRYLHGDKTVSFSQIRALGISPSRITKFNARHLLRSLAEVIHLAGYEGLLIVIDDMEMLVKHSSDSLIKYTKVSREDTYENIRQLIDDIDSMRYLMFLLCFDRELIDNDSLGIKSYQALWMRIQNEVIGSRFNHFSDMLDLDRYSDQSYTPEVLCEMSEKLVRILQEAGYMAHSITIEEAMELEERSQYGGLGLPFLVNRAVAENSNKGETRDV